MKEVYENEVAFCAALLYIHRTHPTHGHEAVVCIGYDAVSFG